MSVASIGTMRMRSGMSTRTGSASAARRYFTTALPTISSSTSSVFLSAMSPLVNRVTESRFSVTRTSHCASRLISSSSAA